MIRNFAIGLATVSVLATGAYAQENLPPRPAPGLEAICGAEGCQWEKVASCDGFIEGINAGPDGTLWMVGYFAGTLLKVENGSCTVVGEAARGPNGAKFAPDGRFLAADNAVGLVAIDLETGARETLDYSIDGTPLDGLNDLAFDPAGGLYATRPKGSDFLTQTGKVFYIPPGEGGKAQVFYEGLAYPNGIAISGNGERAYIAEFAANRVLSVPTPLTKNPFDVPHVFARFDGGLGPDGLTMDAKGNLYVAHFFAGEVVVLDANGHTFGSIRLPEGAGLWTTNLVVHDGYLYVTEASLNEVWRVGLAGDAVR